MISTDMKWLSIGRISTESRQLQYRAANRCCNQGGFFSSLHMEQIFIVLQSAKAVLQDSTAKDKRLNNGCVFAGHCLPTSGSLTWPAE